MHKEGDDLMSATRYAVVMLALREDGYPTQAALDQIRSRRVDGGVTSMRRPPGGVPSGLLGAAAKLDDELAPSYA